MVRYEDHMGGTKRTHHYDAVRDGYRFVYHRVVVNTGYGTRHSQQYYIHAVYRMDGSKVDCDTWKTARFGVDEAGKKLAAGSNQAQLFAKMDAIIARDNDPSLDDQDADFNFF